MKVYTKPAIKFIAVFLAVLMLFSALSYLLRRLYHLQGHRSD